MKVLILLMALVLAACENESGNSGGAQSREVDEVEVSVKEFVDGLKGKKMSQKHLIIEMAKGRYQPFKVMREIDRNYRFECDTNGICEIY